MSGGLIKRFTPHLNLPIPNFDRPLWHTAIERAFDTVDASVNAATGLTNVRGVWDNATEYFDGERVVDDADGSLWLAQSDSVSPDTGTFAVYRAANPNVWTQITNLANYRGQWTTATQYYANEFLYFGNKFGVVTNPYVSGASYAVDEAADNIDTLIDLTTVVTAVNAALTAAQLAETNAETAETNAETSEANAELALLAAEGVLIDVDTVYDNVVAQLALAITARNAAQLAEANAELAEIGAEAAKTAAELAQSNAEGAEATAVAVVTTVSGYVTDAANEADAAALSAADALLAETNAETALASVQSIAIDVQDGVDLAAAYANEAEDIEVVVGEFSAKHWSLKAQAAAGAVTGDIADAIDGSTAVTSFVDTDRIAGTKASELMYSTWANVKVSIKAYTDTLYITPSQLADGLVGLVDAAPGTLDTLNELAAALGDDPNFATTITNQIATKITAFADPNADRIVFWDDSAGAFAPLSVGTGLSLTGTTLTATAGVSNASTTVAGVVELATTAEAKAGTSTSNIAMTPANVQEFSSLFRYNLITTNRNIVATDAGKLLVNETVTTYVLTLQPNTTVALDKYVKIDFLGAAPTTQILVGAGVGVFCTTDNVSASGGQTILLNPGAYTLIKQANIGDTIYGSTALVDQWFLIGPTVGIV